MRNQPTETRTHRHGGPSRRLSGFPEAGTGRTGTGQRGPIRAAVAVLLAAGIVGCGDDATPVGPPEPPEPVGAAGTWTLARISDAPLPWRTEAAGTCVEIVGGNVTLRADASYESDATLRVCGETTTTTTRVVGTWVQTGSVVDFAANGGCPDRAIVTATTMRIARSCDLGVSVEYARQ